MSRNDLFTIKKLQTAINSKGKKILINKSQFYSKSKNKAMTMYIVKEAIWDEDSARFTNVELFSAISPVQIVLFLRDYWYKMNDIPIPTDNEMWEEIKQNYALKHNTGGAI